MIENMLGIVASLRKFLIGGAVYSDKTAVCCSYLMGVHGQCVVQLQQEKAYTQSGADHGGGERERAVIVNDNVIRQLAAPNIKIHVIASTGCWHD